MFARTRPGLKIFETTLTQNILFSFKVFQERCADYSVSLYEAVDERANGNDIELIVQTASGYIMMPTQAKLLYSNLKYSAINHPGSAGYQVDDLINYASTIGGVPVYLLYNYVPGHHALQDHGCTMLTAGYIRNYFSPHRSPTATRWHIPSFNDLHLPALPWHRFICDLLNTEDVMPHLHEIQHDINMHQIQFYTREELDEDERWHELIIEPFENFALIEANDLNDNEIITEEFIGGYTPRFRIVISTGENV